MKRFLLRLPLMLFECQSMDSIPAQDSRFASAIPGAELVGLSYLQNVDEESF